VDLNFPGLLTRLLTDLDAAFDGSTDAQPDENRRAQYAAALAAIHRFLGPIAYKHAEHFLILGDALADLNLGVVWPILVPSKKRKSLIASRLKVARAHVVFALNMLIDKVGLSNKDAAKEVLKEFPAIKYLATGKSKSWKQLSEGKLRETLLRWRTDLKAPSRRKSYTVERALKAFDVFDDIDDVCTPEDFRKAAHAILRDAERVALSVTDPIRLSRLPWTRPFTG